MSAEGFWSLVDCHIGCITCAAGCASPLPLHPFWASEPAASSLSLSSTSTSSSPLKVAEGGCAAGLCGTDCCATASVGTWAAGAIRVDASGACAGVMGAGGAAICPAPLSSGADVYTV